MTLSTLRGYKYKDLAQMAKSEGVVGWHAMRKEELIRALVNRTRRKQKPTNGRSSKLNENLTHSKGARAKNQVQKRIDQLHARLEAARNLSDQRGNLSEVQEDRVVVMVRGPYWLHVHWELTHSSIERARTALGPLWHAAQPALRLFRVAEDGALEVDRQIQIHGGVNHWYLDVQDPPCRFRVEIGYLAEGGQFYRLSSSNTVSTPQPGTLDSVDENWTDVAKNADHIFAMSGGYSPHGASLELQELLEERLNRRMGTPMQTRYGQGATRASNSPDDLPFAVDAELLIHGMSHPRAHVTMRGEPVPLRPDGSFTVRMALPNQRQVIPLVASSSDGMEQQTIILGVDRNTKVLDPKIREQGV